MIAAWIAYSLALSLLIALAALALERVAGLAHQPRRFVWAAAIGASLLVPLVAAVLPRTPAHPAAAPPALAVTGANPTARPLTTPAPTPPAAALVKRLTSGIAVLDAPLLLLWAATSLFLGFSLLRAAVKLHRSARSWSAAIVDGVPVLVAPDVGPAVVRLSGLSVVLPQWALEADVSSRSLMLRHEREHCRARDPDLLLGATLALVATPWNLALWWQVRRLQLAVETDCDRRLMRAGADAHAYSALLLSVGARYAWQPLLAATSFAETPSLLERRIDAMTAPRPRHPVARAFTTTLIAVLAVAAAAMIPQPRQAPGRAAAPPASQLSGRQRPACPSTMGVRLSVSREPGAVTVTDEDMEATARMVVRAYGYEAQLGAAGAQAPLRLEVSLKLQPGYAEAGAAVVRAGEAGAIATALSADTLPAHAGAVAVGSVLGSALQGALGGLPPCHRVTAFPWMSELQTPAAREAVRRNAAAMARLLRTEDAGLWLVQDSTGQYISSGVLDSFPASISSTNYKTVVPGVSATGEDAIAFSLGRTPVVDGAGPFRVAWVTVPRKP